VSAPLHPGDVGALAPGAGAVSAGLAAWIEVRPARGSRAPGWLPDGFLLDRMASIVRQQDQVCPIGPERVAVRFGPTAPAAAPWALGERIVRAMRRSPEGGSLLVAVGIAVGAPGDPLDDAVRRARAATRCTCGSDTDAIVVDRALPAPPSAGRDAPPAGLPLRLRAARQVRRDRRAAPAAPGRPAAEMPDGAHLIVVDPAADGPGALRGGAAAAVEAARRAGWHAAATGIAGQDLPDGPLPTAVDGVAASAVVIVLEAGGPGSAEPWTETPWHRAGLVAAAYGDAGIPVIAVDTGAGAGAVAACAAAGALVLFDVERLPLVLASLGAPDDEVAAPWSDPGEPEGFAALVSLTAAERRVLFHLTAGRAAQEIADHLVLSITTVRSHIRSILRKLGVRSQLAAVAAVTGHGVEPG